MPVVGKYSYERREDGRVFSWLRHLRLHRCRLAQCRYVRWRTYSRHVEGYGAAMVQRVAITIAEEVEPLRAAELDAKHRYYEAVDESNLSVTREAAGNWIRAGDALAEHVAAHRHRYSEYSESG